MAFTGYQPNRHKRLLVLEDAEHEPDEFTSISMDHILAVTIDFAHILQWQAAQTRKLCTQVPNFRGL